MTPSQWLDMVVLAVALIAAINGWRTGALGSTMSLVGFVLGVVAGVLLVPYVRQYISGPTTKLFVTVFIILGLVVVGEVAGAVLGRAVRGAIRNPVLRTVDSVIGVGLQMVTVLIAAWLLAAPFTQSNLTSLAGAVRDSRVLGEVNDLAPDWLRAVPTRVSDLANTTGLPNVLDPFSRTPNVAVDPPNPELANSAVVTNARPSVVKIRGEAKECGKVLEGTGFVVAEGKVMSNAHVVAGSNRVTIETDNGPFDATVVSYDPDADISILDVPGLTAPPLAFDDAQARTGTEAVVLGYPGGGPFVATPARIREIIELNGPDIYRTTTVTREVYTVRGTVRQGNSGGPLVGLDGRVLGVVFGAAVDDNDTGFVLTAKEVERQMARVGNTGRVATGACVT